VDTSASIEEVLSEEEEGKETSKKMDAPLPIVRRISWLQSRSCLWRIAMNCWILWLLTLTRIFEMPKAISLAVGNMYVQNVH